jgi:prepilin-type N-terminal cleavage/methylation domain-containing protein
MKTSTKKLRTADCGLQNHFEAKAPPLVSIQNSKFKIQNCPAFTLIELLAVITIIGILAAFTIPVFSSVKKQQYIKHTQAELALLETAIERYKAAYGFYPPSNTNTVMVSQLFYELEGTTNNNHVYQTLSGSGQNVNDSTQPSPNNITSAFGIGGFMNCSKSGAVEDVASARNFLPDLKTTQFNTVTNPLGGAPVTILIGSVGGPDQNYMPFNAPSLNPWRYNSANPTNNPGSYDLYIQLVIAGKTNLICNWSKQVQINSPLP